MFSMLPLLVPGLAALGGTSDDNEGSWSFYALWALVGLAIFAFILWILLQAGFFKMLAHFFAKLAA